MFHPEGPTFFELLAQALSSTTDGYDKIAPKFDFTPFRTPDVVLQAMAAQIGAPGSVGSALDVCCGTGAAMAWLRPLCTRRVVGLDASQGMLAEARRRLASTAGDAEIELVVGDALALPYDAAFDVITCVGAFGHILREDEDRFVAGIARALRPGGRFVFVTGERPSMWSPQRWILHSFNGAMRIRNALLRPPFIMYYLTFMWPEVVALLARHGLHATVVRGTCPPPFAGALVVVATRQPLPSTPHPR